MDKEDARYQALEELHERRKQVVRLHKRGIKIMKLVEMTGLSYPAVRRTLDLILLVPIQSAMAGQHNAAFES